MKIIFLTTALNGKTGGTIYDAVLYDRLRKKFGNQIKLVTDDIFKNEKIEIKKNYRRFSEIYKNHADDFLSCDYLFVNSRMYTRFETFPFRKQGKCKIIEIHHHFNFETHEGIKKFVHKQLELRFLRHAKRIITPNPYTLSRMTDFGLRNKAILLESFIDNDLKQLSDINCPQFLFVGTVEPRKGLHYAIRAFAEFHKSHPNFVYKIAGTFHPEEAYAKKLLKMVRDYNLQQNVLFLGRVSEEEKASLYQTSMAFVFPSQNEGYGWVLVEAMSYGLPVIAYNNTAMPYTVNNTNGILVENQSVEGMVDAMVKMADRTEYRKKLSNGAICTVKKLPSAEDINNQYESVLEQIEKGQL